MKKHKAEISDQANVFTSGPAPTALFLHPAAHQVPTSPSGLKILQQVYVQAPERTRWLIVPAGAQFVERVINHRGIKRYYAPLRCRFQEKEKKKGKISEKRRLLHVGGKINKEKKKKRKHYCDKALIGGESSDACFSIKLGPEWRPWKFSYWEKKKKNRQGDYAGNQISASYFCIPSDKTMHLAMNL